MIRPARETDLHFVVHSWVGSFAETAIAKSMTESMYRQRWTTLAKHLARLDRVIVDADDVAPDVILGWACHDGAGALHYVFVREDFRNQHRARTLLDAIKPTLSTYTARTTDCQRTGIARRLRYDPSKAWFPHLLNP